MCFTVLFYFINFSLFFGKCSAASSSEMLEQGKLQYQLIQERVQLPKYGSCWKQAVERLTKGCKSLSEETQSDMALHLANCFLELSGHETYNCDLDRKPNLRGICINSMTDRAFNVYTEFYTHTQNICWFLQGQVWQEMISENTIKMGQSLHESTENQMTLLQYQKQSLEMQEKLVGYGSVLEQILVATVKHQELIFNLQSWIIGEITWVDTVVFYTTFCFLLLFLTSVQRTVGARLPILLLVITCIVLERLVSSFLTQSTDDIQVNQKMYFEYAWYLRYTLICSMFVLITFHALRYKDLASENNSLLTNLHKGINRLNENFAKIEYIEQIDPTRALNNTPVLLNDDSEVRTQTPSHLKLNDTKNSSNFGYRELSTGDFQDGSSHKGIASISRIHASTGRRKLLPELMNTSRYNLRSRQGTPDSNV